MLRGHRVSSATPEKLWSIGLRIRKDASGPLKQHQSCALVGHHRARQSCSWAKQIQCRSFSTGTTGLIKEQSPPSSQPLTPTPASAVVDEDGNVLVSAAKEAQRLSDLAAKLKCRPGKDNPTEPAKTWKEPSTLVWENMNIHKREVDEATIQSALEAAQALLFVTRLSSPLQEAIQKVHSNRQTDAVDVDVDIQKQISSLHRAFLAVTSWCLDVVSISSKPDPRMLDMGLQVARRAHQLQLPFHMPLYIRLMNAVAEHYDPNAPGGNSNTRTTTTTGALILEIAGRATKMLGPAAIESSQLFREPLEALVSRRCYGDVAAVLRGIESQYSMLELDKGTLLKLLVTLEIAVKQDKDKDTTDWEETADVLEILNLADPYLWKTITSLSSLSDVWNRKQDKKKERREQIRKKLMQNQEETTEKLLPTLPSHLAEDPSKLTDDSSRQTRRKRSTESYKKKDDLYYVRGWIYNSQSPSAHAVLPDITPQIEALNDGENFRYSEEMERSILKRNMDDEFDEDDAALENDMMLFGANDDEFFSDDEDYSDDDLSDDESDDDDSDNGR